MNSEIMPLGHVAKQKSGGLFPVKLLLNNMNNYVNVQVIRSITNLSLNAINKCFMLKYDMMKT